MQNKQGKKWIFKKSQTLVTLWMAAETNLPEQEWIKKRVIWMASSALKPCQRVLSSKTKLFATNVDVNWVLSSLKYHLLAEHTADVGSILSLTNGGPRWIVCNRDETCHVLLSGYCLGYSETILDSIEQKHNQRNLKNWLTLYSKVWFLKYHTIGKTQNGFLI